MLPVVNYVQRPTRESSFNVVVARALLGGYLIWRLLSFPWAVLPAWPIPYQRTYWPLVAPVLDVLAVEATLTALVLCAFVVGYRRRATAFLSAFLVAHLGLALFTFSPNGGVKSLFVASLLLVGFGLSAGGRRRLGDNNPDRTDEGNDPEQSLELAAVSMYPLQFALFVVAILYFGAGVDKVVHGPLLAWVAPRSLGSYLLLADAAFTPDNPLAEPLRALLLGAPVALTVFAVATIVLELGFLVAVVSRLPVWPFVVGLFGMHVGIVVVMGPFFLDQLVFLALFVAWDVVAGRVLAVLPSPVAGRLRALSVSLGWSTG